MLALTTFDERLFLLINNLPHGVLWDQLFLFFSFYPLLIWLLIGVLVILIEERKEKLFILRLLLALLASGFLASGILKPLVQRPRPDIRYKERVIIIAEKPAALPWNNDFAFPSGHAAVAFAGAYIVTREETTGLHGQKHSKERNKMARWVLYLFAILTAFSRIYLGKHYPLDVIAGGAVGWGVGWATWKLIDLIAPPRVV